MNKMPANRRIIFLIIIAFIVLFSFLLTRFGDFRREGDNAYGVSAICDQVSRLPHALRSIDNEAFEGTALRFLTFEDGLLEIGQRAFLNSALSEIYLPASTTAIGNDAFPLNVTIHALEGSYAQIWAEENGYRFDSDNDYSIPIETEFSWMPLLFSFLVVIPDKNKLFKFLFRFCRQYEKSMRPQDRPELYPIQYRFP